MVIIFFILQMMMKGASEWLSNSSKATQQVKKGRAQIYTEPKWLLSPLYLIVAGVEARGQDRQGFTSEDLNAGGGQRAFVTDK